MISEGCKVVKRTINKFIPIGQRKTQRLVVLSYKAVILICNVYLTILSIFTAEAKAIDLALDFIRTCDTNNKFIIFSYLLSVLKAMDHTVQKSTDSET